MSRVGSPVIHQTGMQASGSAEAEAEAEAGAEAEAEAEAERCLPLSRRNPATPLAIPVANQQAESWTHTMQALLTRSGSTGTM